jgi:hypothetical protein
MKRDASIGTTVAASSSDTAMEKMTTSASCVNICPACPLIRSSGRKTMMIVIVEATTAVKISCVPETAASAARFPSRSMCRKMFSSTTTASSTIRPTASARPARLIVFSEKPHR